MARTGISYEEVAAQADKLAAEGRNASISAVREALGTGSPNTILAHLQRWRAARPAPVARVAELPAELVNAIGAEMQRAAAQARAEAEAAGVELRNELGEIQAHADALENERDEQAELIVQITAERDQLNTLHESNIKALEQCADRIEREQKNAENARLELAKLQLKMELLEKADSDQKSQIAALQADLKTAQAATVSAQQNAAVLAAKLEASEASNADLKSNLAKAENQVQEANRTAENLRTKFEKQLSDERAAFNDERNKLNAELKLQNEKHTAELKVFNDKYTAVLEKMGTERKKVTEKDQIGLPEIPEAHNQQVNQTAVKKKR